ncbi:hypothetical protein DPMN_110529 [Dreissena polymorpha]|uniref:Uncharacterized protein n=1 Tax=Dreissena polymorpha TaxID=45954 RepID=A0A9D4QP21_DREPO|nr:hypothetical protein DPMN_110529 [Dreissena polymorpha]
MLSSLLKIWSPGSISDQPDKCSRASNPSPTQLSSVPEVSSTPVYQAAGPYFPPHLQYVVQHHQQGIVPGYGVASPIPLSTSGSPVASPPSAANDSNFLTILHKLESIECRLVKLDQIESDVSKISKNVTRVEARMCIMETNFSKLETKFNDIETSRQFDSQECHDLKVKLSEFQGKLSTELAQMATLKTEILDLKSNNVSLSNDLLDLKSRSMRDNLLFFNFEEEALFESRKAENCVDKLLSFCENELSTHNARSEIKIDRAHRIGNYDRGSCRPIVVNYFQDKMKIKQQMLDNPRASNKRVSDQFPRAIQERRKILIPYLVKARSDGKRASLVHDKLHIDNATFTVDKLPPRPCTRTAATTLRYPASKCKQANQ